MKHGHGKGITQQLIKMLLQKAGQRWVMDAELLKLSKKEDDQ